LTSQDDNPALAKLSGHAAAHDPGLRWLRRLIPPLCVLIFLATFWVEIVWVSVSLCEQVDEDVSDNTIAVLASSRRAVQLAAWNVTIWSGSRDWSNQILWETRHKDYLISLLTPMVDDKSLSLDRRAGAAEMLWVRTADKNHLRSLFQLAKDPSGPQRRNVVPTRFWLGVAFAPNHAVRERIEAPNDKPIDMTDKEFEELLQDPNNIYWSGKL
jgi:hypothetical protein